MIMTNDIELTDDAIEQHIERHHQNLRLAAAALDIDRPEVNDKKLAAQKAALFGDQERAAELEKQAGDGLADTFEEVLLLSSAIADAVGVSDGKIEDYRTESDEAKSFKAALAGNVDIDDERGDTDRTSSFKNALGSGGV